MISENLQQLVSVNAITSEQAQQLTPGGVTPPAAADVSAGGGPRPLSVYSVLSAAAAASPTDESAGGIIDALFDLAMTVVGAIVGDVMAHDAAEAEVRRRRVNRLPLPRRRVAMRLLYSH